MPDRQGVSEKATTNTGGSGAVAEPAPDASEMDGGILSLQRTLGNRAVSQMIGAGRSSLIVDDDAKSVEPGQQRKTEFLSQLRAGVGEKTDEAVAETGRTSKGCPYIERWITTALDWPAARVERGIRIFAPEAANAETAPELLATLAARARVAAAQWAEKGEVPGDASAMAEGAGLDMAGGLAGALLFKAREGGARPDNPSATLQQLGKGESLSGEPRSRMEAAFGWNFGHVRVHKGDRAASAASGMNARAFTLGEHVAFGTGEYRPGTPEGDALLAHELAHVVQQSSSGPSSQIQHKRIGSEDGLERDADSSAVSAVVSLWTGRRLSSLPARALPRLKSGLRLQRCSDSPKRYEWQDKKLKKMVDDEVYGPAQIRTYVDSLAGANHDRAMNDLQRGRLDYVAFSKTLDSDSSAASDLKDVIQKIDDVLSGIFRDTLKGRNPGAPAPLTEFAPGTAPAALSAGTNPVTANQRTAIDKALSPIQEIDPKTNKKRQFKASIGGVNYETALEKALRDGITWQFNQLAAGKAALHANPAKLHGWTVLENIGNESRKQVDDVFGSYARRTAFVAGTNLLDRWEQQEAQIAAETGPQLLETAKWRVLKIFKDDPAVAKVNDDYGFLPEPPEQGLVDTLIQTLASDPALQPKLLEIQKGWPGSQGEDPVTHQRQVFLQRFNSADDDKNRTFAWRTFQMLIHEYIHSLTHTNYKAYVGTLPELKAHTLREGMTDAFTKIVWSNVEITPALRVAVEGPYHDPGVVQPVPELHVYPATRNAEEVIAIVGIDNAANAYFLGKTELIGKV